MFTIWNDVCVCLCLCLCKWMRIRMFCMSLIMCDMLYVYVAESLWKLFSSTCKIHKMLKSWFSRCVCSEIECIIVVYICMKRNGCQGKKLSSQHTTTEQSHCDNAYMSTTKARLCIMYHTPMVVFSQFVQRWWLLCGHDKDTAALLS